MLRSLSVAFLMPVFAAAQWSDVKQLGMGGESFVAADGKGNVYVTAHLPAQLFISRDYGDAFGDPFKFRNALGDLHVVTWGENRLQVTYMYGQAEGLKSWYSSDAGKNLTEGQPYPGPFDREWIAVNPLTNEVYLTYSDGYIGGPKSKGIYLAASKDGDTFAKRSRVDQEQAGSYAVDPYLANNEKGRLYAAWAASKDYDTIDAYRFAMSDDGGKTWIRRQTIANVHKNLGDCQERWMLGGIIAVGNDTVIVYYQDYEELEVGGKKHRPLLTYFRRSDDAGATFGPSQPMMPQLEIEKAISSFDLARKKDENYPIYIQSLPWMCVDPEGNVHAAVQDNRSGQVLFEGSALSRWAVRYLRMDKDKAAFTESEKVSTDYTAKRPPLDFMSCAADSTRVYITWTEATNPKGDWEFTGKLMLGRKKLKE